MRYFGGGIGHLKNTPPQQVPEFDPIDPSSEEVEEDDDDDDHHHHPCSGTNEDLGTIVQLSRDVVMNGGELEVGEDDEEDNDNEEDDEDSDDDDEEGDQTVTDEDEDEEGEDGYLF